MTKQQIHIIGGGTVSHVRPHLALACPTYGGAAYDIRDIVHHHPGLEAEVHLYITKVGGGNYERSIVSEGKHFHPSGDDALLHDVMNYPVLETAEDVALLIDRLVEDPAPKIIFMPVGMVDFEVEEIVMGDGVALVPGRQLARLSTHSQNSISLTLKPKEKIIRRVRKTRKDIFLVGFKATTGATPQELFDAGLTLLKEASCNLVLANDINNEMNIVVTPEQAPYNPTTDRQSALQTLVSMALERSKGHFTRSKVIHGPECLVSWNSSEIPESLRKVVTHCIERGAYKPFNGKTVGHFAVKRNDKSFFTSMRGVDFNKLVVPNSGVGLVQVNTINDEEVYAYGAKPSVGGQSQRIIFSQHTDLDCIVHFHCPLRDPAQSSVNVRDQAPHECGSHECGQNTSDGLDMMILDSKGRKLKAVMLDKHGPNIVFHRDFDPQKVIDFIERHWDLSRSTSEVVL